MTKNKKNVIVWIFICICMAFHCYFDFLFDQFLFNHNLDSIILIQWHLYKFLMNFFLIILSLLLWHNYRRNWEYIIGLLIFRWGFHELIWYIQSEHYKGFKTYMGLPKQLAIIFTITGIILPLFSKQIFIDYIRIFNRRK